MAATSTIGWPAIKTSRVRVTRRRSIRKTARRWSTVLRGGHCRHCRSRSSTANSWSPSRSPRASGSNPDNGTEDAEATASRRAAEPQPKGGLTRASRRAVRPAGSSRTNALLVGKTRCQAFVLQRNGETETNGSRHPRNAKGNADRVRRAPRRGGPASQAHASNPRRSVPPLLHVCFWQAFRLQKAEDRDDRCDESDGEDSRRAGASVRCCGRIGTAATARAACTSAGDPAELQARDGGSLEASRGRRLADGPAHVRP